MEISTHRPPTIRAYQCLLHTELGAFTSALRRTLPKVGLIYHRNHDPDFRDEDAESQAFQGHAEDSSAPESRSLHVTPISDSKAAGFFGIDIPGRKEGNVFVVLFEGKNSFNRISPEKC